MQEPQEFTEPQDVSLQPAFPLIEPIEGDTLPIEEEKSIWKEFFLELIETLVLAFILYAIINLGTARIRVDGSSMYPTFQNGNFVIVNRLAYQFGDIQRGDVIVFPYPSNPEEDFIKRIIALPGDHISINAGKVFVNGILIDEPYIDEAARGNFPEITVPEGSVFVVGDNRNASHDSRFWGPLRIEEIMGKAVFVYWPFSEFGVVEHFELDAQVDLSP